MTSVSVLSSCVSSQASAVPSPTITTTATTSHLRWLLYVFSLLTSLPSSSATSSFCLRLLEDRRVKVSEKLLHPRVERNEKTPLSSLVSLYGGLLIFSVKSLSSRHLSFPPK